MINKRFLPPHHDCHVAHTLEREVHAPIRHVHQDLLDRLAVILRVHHIRGAKLSGDFELVGIQVHSNDPGGPGCFTAHDGREAQGSQAKHGTG